MVNDAVWIRNLGIDERKRMKELQRGIRYKSKSGHLITIRVEL